MENLNWRFIPNYNNRYLISENGDIISLFSWNKPSFRLLKPTLANGYSCVKINDGFGNLKTYGVHRLVAISFLGEAIGMEVNHKDGIKSNNHISNLEWITHRENIVHNYRLRGY